MAPKLGILRGDPEGPPQVHVLVTHDPFHEPRTACGMGVIGHEWTVAPAGGAVVTCTTCRMSGIS